eukprot:6235905-Heterocapsa_arctica.AAC.1
MDQIQGPEGAESPGRGHGINHTAAEAPLSKRTPANRRRGQTFGHRRLLHGSIRPAGQGLHGRRGCAPSGRQDAQVALGNLGRGRTPT